MKGSGKNIKWLHSQLPEWVSSGLVPPESAEKLRESYPEPDGRLGQRLIFPILAAFGSLLIGGGIILLFAYNWDGLPRSVRTFLSFLPLVTAQLLAVRVYLRNKHSAAWREGIGGFLAVSVVAAIALIGQTYHIPGNLSGLLFVWAILILPLIYLLRSGVAFMIYLGAVAGWAISFGDGRQESFALLGFWLLLCTAVPGLLLFRGSLWANGLKATMSFSLLFGTLFAFHSLPQFLPHGWILFFGFFFSVLFLLEPHPDAVSGVRGLFRATGCLGVFIFSLLLTFNDFWPSYPRDWEDGAAAGVLSLFITFALPAGVAVTLLAGRWKWLNLADRVTGSSGIFIAIVFGLWSWGGIEPMTAAILMSLYVAFLGIAAILVGLRTVRIRTLNWGLLVFSALLLARFFDGNVGIIPRAIAFIAIGVIFLVLNGVLSRRIGKEGKRPAPEGVPATGSPDARKGAVGSPLEITVPRAAEGLAQWFQNLGRRRELAFLLLVFAVQLAVPLSMIVQREITLSRGESLKFEVLPVDPYDPFRGRYVALRHPIYSLPRSSLDFEAEARVGKVVFARFAADENGFARLVEIRETPPDEGAYLKTRIRPVWAWQWQEGEDGDGERRVAIEIPFDRYYMNERKAPEAERLLVGRQLDPEESYARVSLRKGRGVIAALYLDGRPAEEVFVER